MATELNTDQRTCSCSELFGGDCDWCWTLFWELNGAANEPPSPDDVPRGPETDVPF